MSDSLPSRPRDTALDTARALAVIAMVMGHTLDALLDSALRETPILGTYWRLRTLTAPMFFLVSGWVVATVVERSRAKGWDILRARLPRAFLLLALGYLLRLPLWGWDAFLSFDPTVWTHFLGFDALHCVGASLLIGALLFAVIPSRPARIIMLLATMAVLVGFAEPVWVQFSEGPLWLHQTLGGGTATFPLLPWAAFFFAGMMIGVAFVPTIDPRHRALVLALTGVALFLPNMDVVAIELPASDRATFAFRLGAVLVLAAGVTLTPAVIARRLAPLGRHSLGVYLTHLPILYGWGYWEGLYNKIGSRLPLGQTMALGVALLVFSLTVTLAAGRIKAWIQQRWQVSESSEAVVPLSEARR